MTLSPKPRAALDGLAGQPPAAGDGLRLGFRWAVAGASIAIRCPFAG